MGGRREAALKEAQAELSSVEKKMRLDLDSRAFFETLMTKEPPAEQKFLRHLIDNQLSILRNQPSGRVVWHSAVLNWCTDVYRRNPGAYELMGGGGCKNVAPPFFKKKKKKKKKKS